MRCFGWRGDLGAGVGGVLRLPTECAARTASRC